MRAAGWSIALWGLSGCVASVGALQTSANDEAADAGPGETDVRDTTEPVVELTSPERGAFIDAIRAASIEVAGTVRDDGTIRRVTINGHPIELDVSGHFSFDDPVSANESALRTYTVEAVDAAGNLGTAAISVLAGRFANGPVPASLVAVVGPEALDAIADAIQSQLAAIDLDALVREQGAIAETLRVETVRRGAIDVSLDAGNSGLSVTVEVADLEVDLRYEGAWDSDVAVRIERASLGATLRPSLGPDGAVEVDLEHPEASLAGFSFDVSGVGGEDMLRDIVRDALEAELLQILRQQVPPRLEEQIAALGSSWTTPVSGGAATTRLSRVDADARGLEIVADVDVTVDGSAGAGEDPGSPRTEGPTPALEVDGVAAAVSDDLVNALLHATWASGGLARTMVLGTEEAPTTVAAVTLLVPALAGVAPDDAPVQFVLEPLLPGVLEHTEDGDWSIAIGELHMRLEARTDDGIVPLATIVGRVDARLAATLEPEGVLSVSIADWSLSAEPLESRPGLPRGSELQGLLDGVIDMFSIDLAGPLVGIPLPSPAGVVLDDLRPRPAWSTPDWLVVTCAVDAL